MLSDEEIDQRVQAESTTTGKFNNTKVVYPSSSFFSIPKYKSWRNFSLESWLISDAAHMQKRDTIE